MKISPFESEYTDYVSTPDLSGSPLSHSVLNALDDAVPMGEKVHGSSRELLLEAVRSFYFAKQVHLDWERLAAEIPQDLRHVIPVLRADLIRIAVIAVWKVFDTSDRTRSITRTILALQSGLVELGGADAEAARELLQSIQKRTNADVEDSLRYVRHLRNKWAGHASIDRDFDSWGEADTFVSLALIEKALAILVNAYQDIYEVIEMDETLSASVAESAEPLAGGEGTHSMGFHWSAVVVLAKVVRSGAQRSASRLLAQIVSQPMAGD